MNEGGPGERNGVDKQFVLSAYPSSLAMKTLPLLFLCFLTFLVSSGYAAAADNVTGRYTKPDSKEDFFDLRPDGTFTISQDRNTATGTYLLSGNKATLTIQGSPRAVVLEITGGSFVGPDKLKWSRTGEASAAPPESPGATHTETRTTQVASVDQVKILKSMNEIKALATACLLWAADHQDVLPDRLEDLLTDKYLGADKGEMLQGEGTKPKYLYYGKRQTSTSGEARTILLMSTFGAGGGKRVIAHMDGSVVLEAPKSGDFPNVATRVAKPSAGSPTPAHPVPTPESAPAGAAAPPAAATPAVLPNIVLTPHIAPKLKAEARYRVGFQPQDAPADRTNLFWVVETPTHTTDVTPLEKVHFKHLKPSTSGVYRISLQYRAGEVKRPVSNVVEINVP